MEVCVVLIFFFVIIVIAVNEGRCSKTEARIHELRKKKSLNDEACPKRRGRRSSLFNKSAGSLISMFDTAQKIVRIEILEGTILEIEPQLLHEIDELMQFQEGSVADIKACFQLKSSVPCPLIQENRDIISASDLVGGGDGDKTVGTIGTTITTTWEDIIDAFVRKAKEQHKHWNVQINLQKVNIKPVNKESTSTADDNSEGSTKTPTRTCIHFSEDNGYMHYSLKTQGINIWLPILIPIETRHYIHGLLMSKGHEYLLK